MKKPLLLLTTLFILSVAHASPEKDSARIAGNLRAFSDQDWAKIAGDRGSEKYEVARGDTLWDISTRLFGDGKVWPKVWEINNTTILNPHMIEPRMALLFNSGSGLSLPSLVVGGALNNAGVSTVKSHYVVQKDDHAGPVWDEKTPYPSTEWKNLPRQSWENVTVNLPANIDKDGFDTKNRIYLRKPATGIELPHYVACKPIKPLGHVEGSRGIATFAFRGSEVTIRPTGGQLEVNQTYTLMDPNPSEISAENRKALSYDIVGKIKILGVQSGTYIGEVQGARDAIMRGAVLIPEVKRIDRQNPVAGATKVKGTILADRRTGAFMSGQHKWVYINRGTRDGVKSGMIFRIFQNTDPKTNLPLTKGDVFVSGDAQVLQGCEDFSIGVFVWSRGEVPEQYEGILLTDVADEKIRFYFNGEASNIPVQEEPPAAVMPLPAPITVDKPKPEPTEEAIIGPGPTENPEMLTPPAIPADLVEPPKTAEQEDWLDKLDNHKELQSDEENELKELEKFHESQQAKAPLTATERAAPEEGAELPPPPESSPELPPPPPAAVAPPAASNEFPSEEPVVENPAGLVKPPPAEMAKAPKAVASPAPLIALPKEGSEDLDPL